MLAAIKLSIDCVLSCSKQYFYIFNHYANKCGKSLFRENNLRECKDYYACSIRLKKNYLVSFHVYVDFLKSDTRYPIAGKTTLFKHNYYEKLF